MGQVTKSDPLPFMLLVNHIQRLDALPMTSVDRGGSLPASKK